ncbi:lamin tail domain-containing protein, partial [Candidatus Poribacteria bacterium]|nr:lamin tail domain-containing protein [Candidatus Poribacteria bacterium]
VFVTAPAMAQLTTNPSGAATTADGVTTIALADAVGTLPADGYLIIRNSTNAGLPAADALPAGAYYVDVTADGLPDLDALFNNVGGTILLSASRTAMDTTATPAVPASGFDFRFDSDDTAGVDRDLKAGDLYITEIMWGINKAAAGTPTAQDHQWIEIWNMTGKAIVAEAINGLILDFSYDRPAPANDNMDPTNITATVSTAVAGKVLLDRVSNVVGNGWVNDLGQSGSDAGATDENMEPFISMYRDSKGDRGRQIGGGHGKGSWKQSTETYIANHVGTPGAAERTGPRTFGASGVALTVIFNEVANFGSGGNYEWIELRVKSGTPNFEKWRVHIVTGADDRAAGTDPTQEELFTIPKLDTSRFDDILLITKQDPAGDPNHPLAAGYNVEMNDVDQNSGIDPNIRYYVADNPGDIGSAWTKDLPDDGKFVLILRNGNDKANHEKIQDIAGYHPNLKKTTDTFNSDLWPLIGYAAPNFTRNQLKSGAVYRRQKPDIPGTRTTDGNKKDTTAFRGKPGGGAGGDNDNGYKGVGYKRGAAATAQHGGTPGYPNNAVTDKESSLADGAMVTISEIMYQRGNRLPQWIELYNGSKTQAVNLNEWKLKIETNANDEDVDIRKPAVTIQFGGTHIPPMGTIILTSTKATQSTDTINVNHRIIDFWTTANIKSALEVAAAGRRYQLLSETAFKLTLMEKGGGVVDVAGNLGSDGTAMWALPMADEDAEGRSSIIRRYNTGPLLGGGDNAGAAQDGMMPVWSGAGSLGADSMEGDAGWVLASASDLPFEATYYGDKDDMSTPGYRGGSPLPVSLSKFRPERQADGSIVVRWATESELDNAGFNILRSETRTGEFTKLNAQL